MFTIYPSNRSYLDNFIFIGQMYIAEHNFTITAGATYYLQYKTSAALTHGTQREISINAGGPLIIEILEAPSLTDGNVGIDVFVNLNRLSSNTPSSAFYSNPTNITAGTTLEKYMVPTAGGPKSAAAFGGGLIERVYKQNTDYVACFTNSGSQNSDVSYSFIFYESQN
jgi:hypothetical protein